MLLALLTVATVASYHGTYGYGAEVSRSDRAVVVGVGRGLACVILVPDRSFASEGFIATGPTDVTRPFRDAPRFRAAGFSYGDWPRGMGWAWWATFPLWAPMLPLAVPPALWWRRRRPPRPGFPVGPA